MFNITDVFYVIGDDVYPIFRNNDTKILRSAPNTTIIN